VAGGYLCGDATGIDQVLVAQLQGLKRAAETPPS
jgi:hypothetical protein